MLTDTFNIIQMEKLTFTLVYNSKSKLFINWLNKIYQLPCCIRKYNLIKLYNPAYECELKRI